MIAEPGSPLYQRAFPFLPADPDRRGVAVEAPSDWRFTLPQEAGAFDVVVWGRLADPSPSSARGLRIALAREWALHRMSVVGQAGFRVAGIHRLGAGGITGGRRGRLRQAVRAGALVELTRRSAGDRVLDAVLTAADASLAEAELGFGSGGTLIARVARGPAGPGLLRLAEIGTPGDPARTGDSLGMLAGLGVDLAPRPLASGAVAGASWTVETLLPGRRLDRVTPDLIRQVAAALAAFPRSAGPPDALEADLRGITARVPSRAGRTGRLADSIAAELAEAPTLPGVLRHGDLWAGNVLVADGTLSGLIDWDAAHPAGVPGSDLVQLVATELRARERRSLGAAFAARPWDSTGFRVAAADYWPAIGIEPSPRLIELAGLAWWAGEVNGTLTRLPHRRTDERWLASNLDPALAALGY